MVWDRRRVPHETISPEQVEAEIERFRAAREATRSRIQAIKAETEERLGSVEAQIFDPQLMMVDDEARFPFEPGEKPEMRMVRFRTLGCWPLTGAVESNATTLLEVIEETIGVRESERQGRAIDKDSGASMEQKKIEGYF